MKLCEICQGSIQDGEEYESHDKLSTSGAGHTVFRHKVCPDPPR